MVTSIASVPYAQVFSAWDSIVDLSMNSMGIPDSYLTPSNLETIGTIFNSSLTVSPTQNGAELFVDYDGLLQKLKNAGVPIQNESFQPKHIQYGVIKNTSGLFDSGTMFAQREVAEREKREPVIKKCAAALDGYAALVGNTNVVIAPTIEAKTLALTSSSPLVRDGSSSDAQKNVTANPTLPFRLRKMELEAERVSLSGTIGDHKRGLELLLGRVKEVEALDQVIGGLALYSSQRPYDIRTVLREMGFVEHPEGFGPLLANQNGSLDESPLAGYREREVVREYFINPDKIDNETERLEKMFTSLEAAFKSWFSGEARNFRPIDSRGASELRARFLKEYKDYKKPTSLTPEADVVRQILEDVVPQSSGFPDPRYQSHMASNIPFISLMAAWMMDILNQNVIEQSEASATLTFVEEQVINWISSLIGFDPHVAGGSAVSGGTMANLTALLVARNKAFPDIMAEGTEGKGEEGKGYVLVSQRLHYSISRGAGVIGMGSKNVLKMPVDENDHVDMKSLQAQIEKMQSEGKKIIAVVGIAGTSETGAIDDLNGIAKLCKKHNIWFHVDAAFGGAALTSSKYRSRFNGIKNANSVTIDGHKWLYVPFQLGMILFRNREDMLHIRQEVAYTIKDATDLGKDTIEGSRAANALKLWAAMKALGTTGYGHIIDHCMETAEYLRRRVKMNSYLEKLTDSDLNFACFRFVPPEIAEALKTATGEEREMLQRRLNNLNNELQRTFKDSGKGFYAVTKLATPKYPEEVAAIRAIIMNPFTTRAIIDDVLQEFVQQGIALWAGPKERFDAPESGGGHH